MPTGISLLSLLSCLLSPTELESWHCWVLCETQSHASWIVIDHPRVCLCIKLSMAGSAQIHVYCEKQLKENNVTEDQIAPLWLEKDKYAKMSRVPITALALTTLSLHCPPDPLERAVTAEGLSNSTQVLTDVLAVTCGLELVGAELSDDAESCRTKGLCGGWWVAAK